MILRNIDKYIPAVMTISQTWIIGSTATKTTSNLLKHEILDKCYEAILRPPLCNKSHHLNNHRSSTEAWTQFNSHSSDAVRYMWFNVSERNFGQYYLRVCERTQCYWYSDIWWFEQYNTVQTPHKPHAVTLSVSSKNRGEGRCVF
jgi:hypothetical protein